MTAGPGLAKSMGVIALVVNGFFWTCGGIYGTEPIMSAAPPRYLLAACIIMPLVYSIPTALITAELSTAFPEVGGQAAWTTKACGKTIGLHNAWWVWFSFCVDSAIYPQYLADTLVDVIYGAAAAPADPDPPGITDFESETGITRQMARLGIPLVLVVVMTLMALAGVDWIEKVERLFGVVALVPCLLFFVVGVPSIQPQRMTEMDDLEILWPRLVSYTLWMYGGYTSLGALAGETLNPGRSYTMAIFILVPFVTLFRLMPLLISLSIDPGSDGGPATRADFGVPYFTQLGSDGARMPGFVIGDVRIGGGVWLQAMLIVGSCVSFVGVYVVMVMGTDRTLYLLGEEFFKEGMDRRIPCGRLSHFLFAMREYEDEDEDDAGLGGTLAKPRTPQCCSPVVGVRRVYIIIDAFVICGLVFVKPEVLVELEMFIYGLSFALLLFSYLYFKWTQPELYLVTDDAPSGRAARWEDRPFRLPGGFVGAVIFALLPVVPVALNTFFNATDSSDKIGIPYGKLWVVLVVIGVGLLAQLVGQAWRGTLPCQRASRASANGLKASLMGAGGASPGLRSSFSEEEARIREHRRSSSINFES